MKLINFFLFLEFLIFFLKREKHIYLLEENLQYLQKISYLYITSYL